jgi:Ring finger domain
MTEDNDCPICLEPIKDEGYIVLKCKHKMDLDCYFGCEKNRINKCPLCRAIINECKDEEYNIVENHRLIIENAIASHIQIPFPTPIRRRADFYSDYIWNNPAVPIYPSPPELAFRRRIRNQIPYNFSIPINDDEYTQMPRDLNFATTITQDLILDNVFANCEFDITVEVAVYKFKNRVEHYEMTKTFMQRQLDILFEEGFIRKMGTNYRRIV